MKTLKMIAAEWLKANGYDGLYHESDCGCSIDDLMPCGDPNEECEAGYKMPCTPNGECYGDCDFHIGPTKQEASDA